MKSTGAKSTPLSIFLTVVKWLLIIAGAALFVFALITTNWWFVAVAGALMLLSQLITSGKKRTGSKQAEVWAKEALGDTSPIPPADARAALMRFASSTATTPEDLKTSFQNACRNWSERQGA